MRIIGKIVLLPFAAVLSLVVAVLCFLHWIAGTALNILCGLCVIAALYLLFIQGDKGEGVQLFVLGFCVSPFGLPLLADLALEGLGGLCGSMWGYICA